MARYDDTVVARLIHVARRHPDRLALASESGSVTFSQLLETVEAFSETLQSVVRPGDRVVIATPNGIGYVAAFFAVLSAGGIACPADNRWGRREMEAVLKTTEPAAIVMPSERTHPKFTSQAQVRELVDELGISSTFIVPPDGRTSVASKGRTPTRRLEQTLSGLGPSQEAAIFHTSGTSGLPEPVIHSHTSLLACVDALRQTRRAYFKLTRDTVVKLVRVVHQYGRRLLGPAVGRNVWLAPLSFSSIAGHTIMSQSLLNGQALVTMQYFDPRRTLELVDRHHVTYLALNPTMAELCLRVKDFDSFELGSLFVVGLGGAPTSPALAQRIKERFGCAVAIGYGSTELGGGVLASNVFDSDDRQIGSVGKAFPGAEVRIVGDDNLPVPSGETGELVCRTPGMMLGYKRLAGSKSAVDAEGWYHTGDLAVMDNEGYVTIVGRKDELIIRAGQNVHPREVELLLESHPWVKEAAVVGVPDGLAGERIWAFAIPEEGASVSPSELSRFCRGELAAHKLPDQVRIVADLPRAGDGKVVKRQLRRNALLETETPVGAGGIVTIHDALRVGWRGVIQDHPGRLVSPEPLKNAS